MKDLTIQVNPTTNSLIVRGPAARQDELAATLSQLALQLPAPDKPVAEVYRLQRADVECSHRGRFDRWFPRPSWRPM